MALENSEHYICRSLIWPEKCTTIFLCIYKLNWIALHPFISNFQVPTKDYCVVLRCVALLRSINVLWFLIICFEVLCILFQGTHDLWFPSINIAMAIDIFKVLCIVAKYTCSLISLWFLSINKCLVLLFFAHSSSIYCSLVIKDIFRNQILQ